MSFGDFLRQRREEKRSTDPGFSLRRGAASVGIEPSYLSKIERGEQPPPSDDPIRALAKELDEDVDVQRALAGTASRDLQATIRKRPKLFAELIRQLKDIPDHAV